MVAIKAPFDLTKCRRFFTKPASPRQRQYEALRAFFIDQLPSAEVARRFGYSPGSFRVLCHTFRRGELSDFFTAPRPGPRGQPKKSKVRDQVLALRKRNYSIYDISRALKDHGTPLSATAVREILAEEGFAPLPRRLDEERPASVRPSAKRSRTSAILSSAHESLPQGSVGCSFSFPTWFVYAARCSQ